MNALVRNQTWESTPTSANIKPVECRWIFTVKYNHNGTINKYKARLVAKGFTQTYGIDYLESFALVAKLNKIRVIFSIAVNLDWELYQLDVKNVFLNGDLAEEVYTSIPTGFENETNKDEVCKLNKSLYGLKQSPRAWFKTFTKVVTDLKFSQSLSDHTQFTKISPKGELTILIVYVDDIIITGNDDLSIHNIKTKLLMSTYKLPLEFLDTSRMHPV